jgi:hypothetical protein
MQTKAQTKQICLDTSTRKNRKLTSVIASKTGLAHARTVVNHQGLNITTAFLLFVRLQTKSYWGVVLQKYNMH